MVITDKEVLRSVKIANCEELRESIETYTEEERDGRSDMQILADEVSYRLSLYSEDTYTRDDYLEAKRILKRTENGKAFPFDPHTFRPLITKMDVEIARERINEYRRLKSLMSRLEKKGFYGSW